MTWTVVFPCLVGVLELAAAIAYAFARQWLLALAWACYAVAAVAFAFASRT